MRTLKPTLVALAFAAAAPFAITAHAQALDHGKMGGMNMPGMKIEDMGTSLTAGEVRKIDKEARKITLKHGDIKNLDMPGMTMVFQVKDAALLDKVKPGDKVKFTAEKADGAIAVTSIEVLK
ncbi:MAG: copper-binding protein [Rubrivivax sp.]|nr:copper-binding protein [Rubrivivax sp.]